MPTDELNPSPKRFAQTIDQPSDEVKPSGERSWPEHPRSTIECDSPTKAGTVEGERALDDATGVLDLVAGSEAAARKTDDLPQNTVDFAPADPMATVDSADLAFSAGPAAPKPKTTSVPKQVAGYEIFGVLGRGGMGVVYKARQPGLKRVVALKMILAGAHASEHDLARFTSEAEAVARLQHPNIVQIYEIGEEEGRPFFSLEYVDGGCLARELDGQPLPHRKAAEVLAVLAGAMAYAHEHGIVHRDLKPANVLVAADGTAKITDFGLAKRVEDQDNSQTRSGTIIGTPDYMAPEQAAGNTKEVGPLSDVYALGSMFYEFLTGRPPFRSAKLLDTLQQVLRNEPVPPSQFDPKLPRDLETICLKCLQKDPQRRYTGAVALAEDLRRYLAGEPIVARPVGAAERAWRWCRRNPRTASLSAAVALLIVVWASTASALVVRLDTEKGKTEDALVQAKKNYELATINEAQAKRNAETSKEHEAEAKRNAQTAKASQEEAERNAAEAQYNAEVASENAKTAKAEFMKTANLLASLSSRLQQRLRPKLVGQQPSAEVQTITSDVLKLVYEGMDALGNRIGASGVTDFGLVATYQTMGRVYANTGLGTEAMRQFEQGYRLARKLANDNPENDQARANLGVTLMDLGKMELELNDDARAAQRCFVEAHALQQEILDRPKQRDLFKPEVHERLLSLYEYFTGVAELELGHPSEARESLVAALAHRKTHFKLMQEGGSQGDQVSAAGYMAQIYLGLGTVAWHLGDAAAVDENFVQCLKIVDALVQQFPTYSDFQGDLADAHGAYGDAQWRLGLRDQARASYEKSAEHVAIAVERLGKDSQEYVARYALLALAHERLGAIEQAEQHFAQAEAHYQKALEIRAELSLLDPANVSWLAAKALTLAHVAQPGEAAKQAEQVARRAPHGSGLLLQTGRTYAACAVGAADATEKRKYADLAIAALRTATGDDFRDPAVLTNDPNLASLMDEVAFQTLLSELQSRANGAEQ